MRFAIAIIVALGGAPSASGWAQEAETKPQPPVPPATQPRSEIETCKPQPVCRLMISPLVPGAPGGGLKTYGHKPGDPKLQEWAGRNPLDPRSFRLPQDPSWFVETT